MSGNADPFLESRDEKLCKSAPVKGKEKACGHKANTCSRMDNFLFICIVLSSTLLGGFILHLYRANEDLKKKVEYLDSRSKVYDNPEHASIISQQNLTMTTDLPTNVSSATSLWFHLQTAEMKPDGIAVMDIAYLYGNASKLDGFINKTEENADLIFRKSRISGINGCLDEYVNRRGVGGHGDHYCKTLKYFMISERERFKALYDYFDMAYWVKTVAADYNYRALDGGKIQVKSSGIYLIHAHVTFTCIDKMPSSMRLIRERSDESKEIVGGCSTSGNEYRQAYSHMPCSAFQIMQVFEGELVYMDIDTYTEFVIDPYTLHFTVLKLSQNSL